MKNSFLLRWNISINDGRTLGTSEVDIRNLPLGVQNDNLQLWLIGSVVYLTCSPIPRCTALSLKTRSQFGVFGTRSHTNTDAHTATRRKVQRQGPLRASTNYPDRYLLSLCLLSSFLLALSPVLAPGFMSPLPLSLTLPNGFHLSSFICSCNFAHLTSFDLSPLPTSFLLFTSALLFLTYFCSIYFMWLSLIYLILSIPLQAVGLYYQLVFDESKSSFSIQFQKSRTTKYLF